MNRKISWIYVIIIVCIVVLVGCGQTATSDQIKVIKNPDPITQSTPTKQILLDLIQTARVGKVINCEFAIGKIKRTEIIQAWGEPDIPDVLVYKKRDIILSVNEKLVVDEITSYDKRLTQVTLSDTIKILGNPVDEYTTEGDHLLRYQIGNYQVFLGFTVPDKQNPNPKMKYYYIDAMY